ncbi:MAG: TIGR02147 family protein [Cryobacterium sp.]|nr:TIGR02147 family protein [Oligoflexia bacterium]
MLKETNPTARYLSEQLRIRTEKNARYSLRAFAQNLGISPGELSEVLNGKRKLTFKNGLKISTALGHSPVEAENFLGLIKREWAARAGLVLAEEIQPAELERRILTEDVFHLVSDWTCFAIVNLTETKGFRFDHAFIARRLGITVTEAKLALDRLIRIGLVEVTGKKYSVSRDFILAPEGVPSAAVRKFHTQILEKAGEALVSQSIHERDIAGITFAIDPSDIPGVQKEIHTFIDRLATRLAKAPQQKKTEVYHFETALFRLTSPNTKKPTTAKKDPRS